MSPDLPSAGRFDGRVHHLPVRIYYEDTDFTGVVYHANYLRYFERGRSDFLRLIGVSHQTLLGLDPPIGFAVTAMRLAFKGAARVDDALIVRTTFDSAAGARLIIRQALRRAEETLVEAEVEACCIGLDGRPRRPPKVLLAPLAPYLIAN